VGGGGWVCCVTAEHTHTLTHTSTQHKHTRAHTHTHLGRQERRVVSRHFRKQGRRHPDVARLL
jgi:hypothetical protein